MIRIRTSLVIEISALNENLAILVVTHELLIGHLYKHIVINLMGSATLKLSSDSAVDRIQLHWLIRRYHKTL